jgi:hypothetical protein
MPSLAKAVAAALDHVTAGSFPRFFLRKSLKPLICSWIHFLRRQQRRAFVVGEASLSEL